MTTKKTARGKVMAWVGKARILSTCFSSRRLREDCVGMETEIGLFGMTSEPKPTSNNLDLGIQQQKGPCHDLELRDIYTRQMEQLPT
jgi:hypothetical protein